MPRPLRAIARGSISAAALAVVLVACGGDSTSPRGISGTWTGTLSQPNGAIYKNFDYSMELQDSPTTTGASTVSGSARISLIDQPQYYGAFVVTGTLNGTQFDFTELSISAQVPPPAGTSWCLKNGTLTLGQDRKSLSGTWSSTSGCAPGTISLTRG